MTDLAAARAAAAEAIRRVLWPNGALSAGPTDIAAAVAAVYEPLIEQARQDGIRQAADALQRANPSVVHSAAAAERIVRSLLPTVADPPGTDKENRDDATA